MASRQPLPIPALTERQTAGEYRALIQRLDRKIDANRRELRRREKLVWPYTYIECGDAWEKHPELYRRERNLFWLRGEFQIHRDRLDAKRASHVARTARLPKRKPCESCGGSGLARAA